MRLLGISLVPVSDLSTEFQEIAKVLSSGKPPSQIWMVYYDGKPVAVFPDIAHAYDRLLHVVKGLENGQTPDIQTLAEAELFVEVRVKLVQHENSPPQKQNQTKKLNY